MEHQPQQPLQLNSTAQQPGAALAPGKAAYISDRRPQAVVQRQQVAGMKKNTAPYILQRAANNKTGLPHPLKAGIEHLGGVAMDDVKVHYNSPQPAQLQAHAYAQGTDIHIAPGQEKHLQHEAWHVVQQKQGRVRPTMQLKGKVNVNDDEGLEKEADVMGAKAVQLKPAHKQGYAERQLNRSPGTVLQPKNTSRTGAMAANGYRVVQLAPDPASKQEALERHALNQQRVYDIVDAALNSHPPQSATPSRAKLLKNTCELIRGNVVLLYVMSKTTAQPVFRADGQVGYFDSAVRYPNLGGTYNDIVDNHVYMLEGAANAHAEHTGEVRIFDPSDLSDETIKTVLIHEMQHQIDQHGPNQNFRQADGDPYAQAINGYQTEFRAYWQGALLKERAHLGTFYDTLGFAFLPAENARTFPSGSLLVRNFSTHFNNQRQEKIFWHLMDSSSYAYIKTAFRESAAFRNMVYGFTLPVGGNLINSARIEALRLAIVRLAMARHSVTLAERNVDTGTPTQKDAAMALMRQKEALGLRIRGLENVKPTLDWEDVAFLGDRTVSAPFWAFANEKLGQEGSMDLYQFVQNTARNFYWADFHERHNQPLLQPLPGNIIRH